MHRQKTASRKETKSHFDVTVDNGFKTNDDLFYLVLHLEYFGLLLFGMLWRVADKS